MKKLFLQSVVLCFISLLLLTSCMGEGPNVQSGQAFGIVRFDYKSGKNLLDVADDVAFYNIRFKEAYDDDCFFITYEINYDKPENSLENVDACGYFEVDIYDKIDAEKRYLYPVLRDTSVVMLNELPVVEPFLDGLITYLQGKLFMVSTLQMPTDQKMDWDISYDRDNMMSEEYGQRYYNVFLRAYIRDKEGTNSKDLVAVVNAFEMKNYLEIVADKEKAFGASMFSIRVNYPSAINENGKITWNHKDIKNFIIADFLKE